MKRRSSLNSAVVVIMEVVDRVISSNCNCKRALYSTVTTTEERTHSLRGGRGRYDISLGAKRMAHFTLERSQQFERGFMQIVSPVHH